MQKWIPELSAIVFGGSTAASTQLDYSLFDQHVLGTIMTIGEFFTMAGVVIALGGLCVSIMRLYLKHYKKRK